MDNSHGVFYCQMLGLCNLTSLFCMSSLSIYYTGPKGTDMISWPVVNPCHLVSACFSSIWSDQLRMPQCIAS